MASIYNLSIRALGLGIKLAAPFNRKARLLSHGRKGLVHRIQERMDQLGVSPESGLQTIWIHCASLGEFEQGRPLIEALRDKHPPGTAAYRPIVVTFFSPSGYEVRKNYDKADAIFYLPSDTPKHARAFLKAVRPQMAIFVKYEYWYNYLSALKQEGIPSYVVSAIFRPDMIFFKQDGLKALTGDFMRKTLNLLTHFFVQNESSKQLLDTIGIGPERVTVSGDTRFDRVVALAQNSPELPLVAQFTQGYDSLVSGSTWPQDEELLLPLMEKFDYVKFIIAPHEIDSERIDKLIRRSGRKAVKYTEVLIQSKQGEDCERLLQEASLMIIDTVGILSSVYRYGSVAYIGGGFGRGIHNTLEAATWGMPLLFGPNYQAFAEAVDLVKLGAGTSVSNFEELNAVFTALAEEEGSCALWGPIAESYVRSRAGATRIIMGRIDKN